MMLVYDVINFLSRCLVPVVLWFWFSSCIVLPARAETSAVVQHSSRSWQTDEDLPQSSVLAVFQAAQSGETRNNWQMWWLGGFAALAMAGILGGSVRFATRRKLERRLEGLEEQNAIEKERTRIAQDMHDDLGARLTEILLLNELARKNQQNPNSLDGYLKKQSLVVRDVAESLNAIVWAVSPANDSLDRLGNYLYDQVERLLAMRSIRCRFDVPNELPGGFVSSEVRHNLFLTVRECLNNVIKHSGASEVWFRLRHGSASLSIVVEDNGRGITETDRVACGNGLQNMERRMKSLGGSFRLNSQPGKGTQIRLEVPLRPDANKHKRIHPKK